MSLFSFHCWETFSLDIELWLDKSFFFLLALWRSNFTNWLQFLMRQLQCFALFFLLLYNVLLSSGYFQGFPFIFFFFPLFLTFIILTIMCPDIILFYFLHLFCLGLLSFLNLLIYVFHQIWEICSHYFSNSFCVPFSLFSLSGTVSTC